MQPNINATTLTESKCNEAPSKVSTASQCSTSNLEVRPNNKCQVPTQEDSLQLNNTYTPDHPNNDSCKHNSGTQATQSRCHSCQRNANIRYDIERKKIQKVMRPHRHKVKLR